MEFSSDSEGGPKMGPAGEQTEEEKEAIEAYMAYIENERGTIPFSYDAYAMNDEITKIGLFDNLRPEFETIYRNHFFLSESIFKII